MEVFLSTCVAVVFRLAFVCESGDLIIHYCAAFIFAVKSLKASVDRFVCRADLV